MSTTKKLYDPDKLEKFDLASALEKSISELSNDIIKGIGKRDGYSDVLNYIHSNNLLILKPIDNGKAKDAESEEEPQQISLPVNSTPSPVPPKQDEPGTAEWLISHDGYYPYCSHCHYEPSYDKVSSTGVPAICENCGCIMTNAKEMNTKNTSRKKA